MHRLLRCNINAGDQACGRNGRITQRCHKSPDGKRGYRVRVTSRTRSARRIWGILKKSVSWVESCLGRKRLNFACSSKPGQQPFWRVPHVCGGGRWKSQNRKNVYLSPYVEEPFVPELRSRKCFSCFEIPMFYVYMLWTFYEYFPYSCMGLLHSSTYLVYSTGHCSSTYVEIILRRLILQCSSLSIILTSSDTGRWFPFPFYIWSAIFEFSIRN